ncbi:MAG: BBP7 family outer membrane beta-barrel protein [Planctomycetota bacterium]|nr:BBP7 family outer membrane beta-barrel protein [Planctomycetota bacterium]
MYLDYVWFRAEALMWWSKSSVIPPLVTTSPIGTAPENAGVLGNNTAILFGNRDLTDTFQPGGRITIGYWIGDDLGLGVEASYLALNSQSASYLATSPETAILARPYFDLQTNSQAAMLVAHPDFLDGTISVHTSTEFQTAEALLRWDLPLAWFDRAGVLIGYRYAQQEDAIQINQMSRWITAQGVIPAGTTKQLTDAFATKNQFHGAELGLVLQKGFDPWSIELVTKLGIGNSHTSVDIAGSTVTSVPGLAPAPFVGGLLAQSTNIGTHESNTFALLPEVGLTVGYDITCNLKLFAGYTFLYWPKVARVSDQIDLSLSQLPPEAPTGVRRPQVPLETTGFWVQGINLGLQYRF